MSHSNSHEYPTKWVVCPKCRGKGTIVNPSIDGNGIPAEQFQEDLDFYEDYMSGMFDITCPHCKGRTTVSVPDFDLCSDDERVAAEEHVQEQEDEERQRQEDLRIRWYEDGCPEYPYR